MCQTSKSFARGNSSDENGLKNELFAKLQQNFTEIRGESAGFSSFVFCFHTLVFEDLHIKNYGHYFNIVALSCSILANPNLTFFDVNNNFELAIILLKVYFRTFFGSKQTNLTLISVLVNTLLIFKHETLTYVPLLKYWHLLVMCCLL